MAASRSFDDVWSDPDIWIGYDPRTGVGWDRRPGQRAAAITTAEIRKLCRACGPDLAGARDQAMLVLGFAGALRHSELVGLDMEHVTWTGTGLKLLIERSKTDAEGEGAEIVIPQGQSADTCPLTALTTWLELSEITAGPLLRTERRLSAKQR